MRYAVVDTDGMVTNIILWSGTDEFSAPDGCELIQAPDEVYIGCSREGNEWIIPEPPEPEAAPPEDPTVTQAKLDALTELTTLGVSEETARVIVGLPAA